MTSAATAEAYERTFQLWSSPSTSGVCFAVDVDGRQYAATARHVVETARAEDLRITRAQARVPFGATRIWLSPEADVAVISLGELLAPPHLTLPLTRDGVVFGQDVYFLGFPYGLTWSPRLRLHRDQPIPLVKHAVLSGEVQLPSGRDVLLLDGHNNEGFSGGPVAGKPGGIGKTQAIGVVSGYRGVPTHVRDAAGNEIGRFLANTGLMLVEPIDEVLVGARALGDGFELETRPTSQT